MDVACVVPVYSTWGGAGVWMGAKYSTLTILVLKSGDRELYANDPERVSGRLDYKAIDGKFKYHQDFTHYNFFQLKI